MEFEHISRFFLMSLTAMHVVLILIFLGIVYINPVYVETASTIVRSGIAFILLIRFNPFTKVEFKKYDAELIFTSAALLLFNEVIEKYVLKYYDVNRQANNVKAIVNQTLQNARK
jgi:hypothetical protein